MLNLYKTVLAPALLVQGARLRKSALRLPEADGPRSGMFGAGTTEPLRLLFVGDSSAAGVGVDWQHEALAHQTAQFVSSASNRAVSWELIAKSGVNTREAIKLIEAHSPRPADVLISALGVNDVTSQNGTKRFISDYTAFLNIIEQRTGARAAVVSGLPPLHILPAAPQPLRWYLGQCARRLDQALNQLCTETSNMKFVSLAWAKAHEMARDKFHPGKGQYRRWAELVAEQVLSLAPTSVLRPCGPTNTQAREPRKCELPYGFGRI